MKKGVAQPVYMLLQIFTKLAIPFILQVGMLGFRASYLTFADTI